MDKLDLDSSVEEIFPTKRITKVKKIVEEEADDESQRDPIIKLKTNT